MITFMLFIIYYLWVEGESQKSMYFTTLIMYWVLDSIIWYQSGYTLLGLVTPVFFNLFPFSCVFNPPCLSNDVLCLILLLKCIILSRLQIRAYLRSYDNEVWCLIENGWYYHTQTLKDCAVEPLPLNICNEEKIWVNDLNTKGFHTISNVMSTNITKHILGCKRFKETWDYFERNDNYFSSLVDERIVGSEVVTPKCENISFK